MRWMNTRSSGHEEIFAPLFLAFESGNEVIVADILEKLLADPQLYVLCGFRTLRSQALNVRGNIYTPGVAAAHRYTRLIDPPFRDDAIAIQALVQFRRRLSVKIHVILAEN